MIFNNNEDWNLCWNYLSSTGCRNSRCKWRHEHSADRFCQKYVNQTGNNFSCQEATKKTPDAQIYRVKQHQDGLVENEYGLYYTDVDEKDGSEKSIQFRKKLGYQEESEDTLLLSCPSCSSSSVNASDLNSTSTAILMSQLTSDSEDDMMRNDLLDFDLDFDKFQKPNSCAFLDLYGGVKEREWLSGKPFTSTLSPFAKAFVPRKSMMSKDGISASLSMAVNNIKQPGF